MKPTLLCLAVIGAATLWCYWSSLSAPFLFDDDRHILQRPEIRELQDIGPLLFGSRRPVLLLSLALNYSLGEFDVRGYHLFNVGVHIIAGCMLFLLVRDSAALRSKRTPRAIVGIALSVALIWVIHPLQTQSVTYIVQRCEALMGLFFLSMLYCLLRGSQSNKPLRWYLAGVASFALGLGSKEVMASAMIVAPLYDRIFLANSWREVWRRRWGFYSVCLVLMLVLIGIVTYQSLTLPVMFGGFGKVSIGWWEYLRTQPGVILHYLRLCFWPDRLCLDYDWPVAQTVWQIVPAGAVVLAMLCGSLWLLRYRPRWGWVAVSFFLILAPSSSFMPIVDLAFEHRMYLPLACVATLVVLGIHGLLQRIGHPFLRGAVAAGLLAATLGLLSTRTIHRNRDYENPVRMWQDVVTQAPHNYKAFYNLGVALAAQRRQGEAIAAYGQALKLRPRYGDARYNMALQLDALGRVDEACVQYEMLLEIAPEDASAHFNLAGIHHRSGRRDAALHHYREALHWNPHHLRARGNLASLLAGDGHYAEAEEHLQKAIALAPDKAWLYDNYGNLFARQSRHEEALLQYDRASKANGRYTAAYLHKARSLHELDRGAEAIALLRETRQRFPRSVAATHLLADLLVKAEPVSLRNASEAIKLISPLAQGPGNENYAVLSTLAACQAELGQFPDAMSTSRDAIRLAEVDRRPQIVAELKRQHSLYAAGSRYRADR